MDDSYNYTIAVSDSLIRVKTSGEFDHLSALKMWSEVTAICEKNDCYRILTISNLDRPLPATEVFNSSDFFAAAGLDRRYRLAVVTSNEEVHESHRIAASALKAHSMQPPFQAAAFDSEREAIHWLHEDA